MIANRYKYLCVMILGCVCSVPMLCHGQQAPRDGKGNIATDTAIFPLPMKDNRLSTAARAGIPLQRAVFQAKKKSDQKNAEVLPLPGELNQPAPSLPSVTGRPLGLEELLTRVDAAYPELLAAQQEQIIAAGKALSSRGAFDYKLVGEEWHQSGSFDSQRRGLKIGQQTPLGGISWFTGYRLGVGDYPSYYQDRLTAEGGEFNAGVLLPLLRDRAIDENRANVYKADVNQLLANPFVQTVRIHLLRMAAYAYWDWVSAGQVYRYSQTLLEIAQKRNEGLIERAKKGDIAGIEVKVNERTIVSRQAKLVLAERKLQKAAIKLSLFYRDEAGMPILPPLDRLPPEFPRAISPNIQLINQDVELAWRQRPELREYNLLIERARIDLEHAENQTLPGLDIYMKGAQDVGPGKKGLDRNTYEAAILLDVPLQRRKARGKILATQGKLAQLSLKERLARDKIQAEVRDAVSALDRFYALVAELKENVRLALLVQQAEQEKLRLGDSTVVIVNLQELAAFEAEISLAQAYADYFAAYADYRAALGMDAVMPIQPSAKIFPLLPKRNAAFGFNLFGTLEESTPTLQTGQRDVPQPSNQEFLPIRVPGRPEF